MIPFGDMRPWWSEPPFLLPCAGAQPDYSQAWIEYYRSLGMFREAEMIEQQTRGNQGQQVRMPYLLATLWLQSGDDSPTR